MTKARPTTPAARDPDLAAMRAMVCGFQLAVMRCEQAEFGVVAGPHPGGGEGLHLERG